MNTQTDPAGEIITAGMLPFVWGDDAIPAGEIITAEMLPFVRIDDAIIYLHRYDGFVIAESHCWGEWLDFSIMGCKDGKWHSVGLCYGHRPLYGGYDRETANFLIQAGMDAIKVALEKWNERGTS